MSRKKRKRTSEEIAAERLRRDDLTRRLQAMIERYRARSEERRRSLGEAEPLGQSAAPARQSWARMSRGERAAERARSRDLDRRLLAAIDRYRAINAESRRRREAEAS